MTTIHRDTLAAEFATSRSRPSMASKDTNLNKVGDVTAGALSGGKLKRERQARAEPTDPARTQTSRLLATWLSALQLSRV